MVRGIAFAIHAGVAASLLLGACGGGGAGNPPANPPPSGSLNTPPTADAGAAQSVTSGANVSLDGTASSDSDGSIAGFSWTQTSGIAVALNNAATAQPSFVAPTVTAPTTLRFSLVVTDNRGASSAASSVTITVNPVPTAVTVSGTVRFERFGFLSTPPFGLNYAVPLQRPARGVVVRALHAGTQALLAATVTDSNGAYTLTLAPGTSITLQVEARMQQVGSALPRWNIRVQDGVGSLQPYTYTTEPFDSSVGTRHVDIPSGISPLGVATGVRASGPFAILDTLYTAMQTVLMVKPDADLPALYVDWGSQRAGTFFTGANGQHIALMADLTEDTDEFDQHVIAHEFGHYLERNFSRSDSLGGTHGLGDRLDMRVAFGEGFGYAFAAIALGDPIVRDSFVINGVHRGGGFNVETNPPNLSSAGPGCWCSETSVWSLLWDLYDDASPFEPNDTLALGWAPLWEVLTGPQRTTPAVTSIFSFIEALKLARPADAAAIDALVAAQNITAAGLDAFATTETLMPFAGIAPLFATITPGVPVVVRSIDDGGLYNKAGNRRLLRFTAPVTGTVNISVVTSNTNVAPNAADPDFLVWRSGVLVAAETDPPSKEPARTETGALNVTAGQTYIIDAYDCANGCTDVEGIRGDYDLTVTLTY